MGDLSVEELYAVVATRLRARWAEIDCALSLRMESGVRSGGRYHDIQRAAVTALIDYTVSCLEKPHNRLPVPPEVSAHAIRAAATGIRLESLARAYLASYAALGDFIVRSAQECGLRPEGGLADLLHWVQGSLAADLVASACAAYARATKDGEETGPDGLVAVTRLLRGESNDLDFLSYELDAWHIGCIAEGPTGGGGHTRRQRRRSAWRAARGTGSLAAAT